MEEHEIQDQVNRKFIRPTYRPFQEKRTQKIDMSHGALPTYRANPNEKMNRTALTDVSPQYMQGGPMHMQGELIEGMPMRMQGEHMQKGRMQKGRMPMQRGPMQKGPMRMQRGPMQKGPMRMQRGPMRLPRVASMASQKEHNCCDIYHDIQSCPVCQNMYKQKDGVYLAVIVILSVIIIFLLKKMFLKSEM